ncbi:PH domain-containing protein [Microbacterium halophytorum]|uniref:PH domain-containing protein n=1 Tax=Microbacterium halophytorum TaxID=2067568 RepID=UPI000CFE0C12|nr:PH domain-containing protein [Microbacterium halophytorum]
MTPQPVSDASATAPLAGGGSSTLADGEWHRLHPLTPLFRGGIALVIIVGVIVANLRDRLIAWFVAIFDGNAGIDVEYENGDPVGWAIDWTLANNFVLIAMLGVLLVVAIICGLFWLSWRRHEFRITDDHVEIRRGVVFRTQRRAPLDRVQGVNLTRPFVGRLVGIAKLEVDGAGTDANVPLEYLGTARAEEVRADILRLASGVRAARAEARAAKQAPAEGRGAVSATVSAGVQGLIDGVDTADVAPESLVKLPTGRIIGAQLLDIAGWVVMFGIIWLAVLIGLIPVATGNEDGAGEGFLILGSVGLVTAISFGIAIVAILWAKVSKALRYSIADTPNGVRVTYGLTTTTTQTIPPGRIHALEITQPLFWRPFGWWHIRVNRVSGKSASQQQSGQAQQFSQVLPVGTRADVERVLRVCLPHLPVADLPLLIDNGMFGPVEGADDPYRTMARRGWWRRPVSFRRHGFAVSDYGLFLRRGVVWRKQAVFPLARLQGLSIAQGPIDRMQKVAWAQAHAVAGVISGQFVGMERDDATELLERVRRAAVAAAANDPAHRWGTAEPVPGTVSALPAMAPAGAPGAAAHAPGGPPYVGPAGHDAQAVAAQRTAGSAPDAAAPPATAPEARGASPSPDREPPTEASA